VIERTLGITGITANNGLTASTSTNVQLGSTTAITGNPLLHDTYLNGSTFTLTMYSDAATGVSIQNTNNGTALYTQSGTGFGLKTFSNSISAQFQTRTSSTNIIEPIIQVQRRTFGTPAVGMGGSIDFYLDAVTPVTEISNQLISKWTDATDATRSAQFEIWGVNSGVSAAKFIVKPSGIINIPIDPPNYANNVAAITGGLAVGDIYRNGDVLQIVH
jgi:hypothetical protein